MNGSHLKKQSDVKDAFNEKQRPENQGELRDTYRRMRDQVHTKENIGEPN